MKPDSAPTVENVLIPKLADRMARIRSDLRTGLPCHVSSDTSQAIVVPVENLTQERLDALRQTFGMLQLVLTGHRADALLMTDMPNSPIRIAPPAKADINWFRSLADAGHDKLSLHKGPLNILTGGDVSLSLLALRLVKFAELLPSAVVFEMPLAMDVPNVFRPTHVDAAEADGYFAQSPNLAIASSAALPLQAHDSGRLHVFRDPNGIHEHMALEIGTPQRDHPVLCRLHSACFTGDVLGSLKCDCGPQLRTAMRQMGDEGAGVLLYLNQEGRGIGLANKMRVYDLQSQGFDTVEANHKLGFDDDERDFRVASVMLRTLGFDQVRLLTNNPAKVNILREHGTIVTERLPLHVGKNPHNSDYLAVKSQKSGHVF